MRTVGGTYIAWSAVSAVGPLLLFRALLGCSASASPYLARPRESIATNTDGTPSACSYTPADAH